MWLSSSPSPLLILNKVLKSGIGLLSEGLSNSEEIFTILSTGFYDFVSSAVVWLFFDCNKDSF